MTFTCGTAAAAWIGVALITAAAAVGTSPAYSAGTASHCPAGVQAAFQPHSAACARRPRN